MLCSSAKKHALATKSLGIVSVLVCCLTLKPDALNLAPPSGRMSVLPPRTLWVWERRENLGGIDPRTTAIATLDSTLLIGRGVTVIPRRQPVIYPDRVRRISVIRIEAPGDIAPGLEGPTASLIVDLASNDPHIAALQIDFDARRSQRPFYARLLREVRRRMPPSLPLSMTALASWCTYDDWLSGLPVDEAVPMFFRMEPDRRFASRHMPQFRIRERLCANSIGVSTREPYDDVLTGKRVYIFPDRGWRQDLHLISETNLTQRTQP
jgi:hypothetical protein